MVTKKKEDGKMINFKNLLDIIGILIVVLAFLFVGIYPYIQIHNRNLADKLKVWYIIAKEIVKDESSKNKTGAEKKASATKKLVKHAANLKVPVNKDFANDLIQHVYNETKK